MTDPAISEQDGSTKTSGGTQICVPLKALEMDGTPPAQGDSVEFTTKGTVEKVANGMAYVEPESFNDEPAPGESPNDSDVDQMGDNLRNQLTQNENQSYT